MKHLHYILLIIVFINSIAFCQTPNNDKHWKLSFSDEFSNSLLFDSLYNPRVYVNSLIHGDCKYNCTQELQCYRKENIVFKDSIVSLVAIKESYIGLLNIWEPEDKNLQDGKKNLREFEYTSGAFMTRKRMSYGYYEIRCKSPKGKGFWPAFWLFHDPGCNNGREIDIYEPNGMASINANTYTASIHYTVTKDGKCRAGSQGQPIIGLPDLSKNFHIYGVEWTPERVYYYFDNKLINTFEGKNIPNNPMHIFVNLAIDPWYSPNSEFTSQSFDIDYIRHYRLQMDSSTSTDFYSNNFTLNTYEYSVKKSIRIENSIISNTSPVILRATDSIEFTKNIEIPIGTSFYANTTKKQ